MPLSLEPFLPSLQSFGLWTLWAVAGLAFLEAVVVIGAFVPGAVAVLAAGMLAQRGGIGFVDLAWFAAAGTILGSVVSFRLGRLVADGPDGRASVPRPAPDRRAEALLARYGGFAMVPGRFLWPLASMFAFVAGRTGMHSGRFLLWTVASALPYALLLPAIGWLAGEAVGTPGAATSPLLVIGIGAVFLLALLWLVVLRARRALPGSLGIARQLRDALPASGNRQGTGARHPAAARRLVGRLDPDRFSGLPATILGALFLLLLGAWLGSVSGFVAEGAATEIDLRLATLLHAMRDPVLVDIFARITTLGSWELIVPLGFAATAIFLLLRRYTLIFGFWSAVIGNAVTVKLLKAFFARPRPDLGYFVETSGSFPSGHASGAMVAWGMLFYAAWRVRALGATAAIVGAATLISAVGLSRVYLISHYLSDVLNGYLVGALWLVAGVALAESLRARAAPRAIPSASRRRAAIAVAGLALAMTLGLAATLTDEIAAYPPAAVIVGQAGTGAGPQRKTSCRVAGGKTDYQAGDRPCSI